VISSTLNEIVALIANVALALSLVVALIFGIAQVRAAARDRRERLTLEALRGFQTREFAEFIYRITARKIPRSSEELHALPAEDQIPFIQFAQQMESLGILVAEGLVNIDLVDRTLGSFVTTAWEEYRPVFLDMRQKTPDPFLGEYFQWLAESIGKRMRETPRKPAYISGSSGTRPR
jgi:hypothetical protein